LTRVHSSTQLPEQPISTRPPHDTRPRRTTVSNSFSRSIML
jgi:hypothetical protein